MQKFTQGHFFTVAVPVSRPEASRKVMVLPRVVLVPVIRPDESRKVVLPVLDCVAVPVVLPCASLKVVLVPDVLVVVEALPFSSLSETVLPASEDAAGSAKARTGNRRARISFMQALDDVWPVFFIMVTPTCNHPHNSGLDVVAQAFSESAVEVREMDS